MPSNSYRHDTVRAESERCFLYPGGKSKMPVGIIVDYYEQKLENCNAAIEIACSASERASRAVLSAQDSLGKHKQEKKVYDPRAHDEQDNKVIDAECAKLSELRVQEGKCNKDLGLLYKKRASIQAKLERWWPHVYRVGAAAPQ